jgi:flagellin-like hook-associated protein FlgL
MFATLKRVLSVDQEIAAEAEAAAEADRQRIAAQPGFWPNPPTERGRLETEASLLRFDEEGLLQKHRGLLGSRQRCAASVEVLTGVASGKAFEQLEKDLAARREALANKPTAFDDSDMAKVREIVVLREALELKPSRMKASKVDLKAATDSLADIDRAIERVEAELGSVQARLKKTLTRLAEMERQARPL